MGSLFGASSAEKAAARAAEQQATQMRENAERDRAQALLQQQAAQQQQEALANRQRAEAAAAALLENQVTESVDVDLEDTVEAEVDPETGRRRRPRDAYQAPTGMLTGIKI